MKKVISLLLTVIMVLCMFTVPVMAADPASVSAKANYTTKTISVVYENTANYDCYVTIYMVDAEVYDDAVFEDFDQDGAVIRMAVKEAAANSDVEFEFILGDDIKTGTYNFYAAPSGKNGSNYYAKSKSLKIIGETADEGDDSVKDVLDYINAGDASNISDKAFEKLEDVIEIESNPAWRSEYLYEVKKDDYNDKFSTITEVADAIEIADALHAVGTASSSAFAKTLSANSDVLGIDLENKYYVDDNFKSDITDLYKANVGSVKSKIDNLYAFEESIAVAVINNGTVSEKADVITKYYKALGITDELYALIEDNGAEVIARHFAEDFSPADKTDVVTEILSVISAIENEPSTEPPAPVVTPGANKGNGGIGGGITIPNEFATQTTTPAYTTTFADVPSSHWANAPVEYLASVGVLSGKGDGNFDPDATVTREEFVKMIVAAFKYTHAGDGIEFADVVKGHWAYDYIKIAYENNIVNGISADKFGVGSPITRQDMAVIIMRVVNDKGIALTGSAGSFADNAKIADYAKESVVELVAGGILNGYNDGTFRPEGPLTRAEAAKVIYALVNR